MRDRLAPSPCARSLPIDTPDEFTEGPKVSRRVSCVPSTDDAFHQAASDALAGIDGSVPNDRIEFRLAESLSAAYPGIHVRRQTELARSFDEDVWYAYRDGRPNEPDTAVLPGPALARQLQSQPTGEP
jgi:hypothetical protein